MKNTNFFRNFTFDLSENPCTLKYLSKYYLTKALRKLFKEIKIKNKINDNQIIGILLKIKYDNDSINSISTLRKGKINCFTKFSTLFKHLLVLRSENIGKNSTENLKAVSIIFYYHIYPMEYNIDNLMENDLLLEEEKEIKKDKNFIEPKVDENIRYMNPFNIFKLPLLFSGSNDFIDIFKKLNKNVNENFDLNYKYRIIIKNINPIESEVKIVLQEHKDIIIYSYKDKLITVPKLDFKEILIERTIMSRITEIYLIDLLSNNILLHKRFNINKKPKGFINRLKSDIHFNLDNLKKFVTFDIEAITSIDTIEKDGDFAYFDPVMICAHDFYNNSIFTEILKTDITKKEPLIDNEIYIDDSIKKDKYEKLSNFFLNFMQPKYHKFILYAHNMSNFDIIFIFESLLYLADNLNIKIEPLKPDNVLISIKIRFGYQKDGSYRYYIEIHDSLLLLNSSLDKLSKTFLEDKAEIQKMNNEKLLDLLLNEKVRKIYNNDKDLFRKIYEYCERDVLSLSHIMYIFTQIIYDKFKVNVHKYPTISSLGMAIYLNKYLESDDLIPRINGEIYNDISKAYKGGHTDVYQLYSEEDVHSYDFSSMYPTQMLKHKMPVGKIDKFEGNPLLVNETFQTLIDKLAFIKCSVYVDKSLNRPTYMTNIILNGEMRSICATGLFLNQWVFVPELAKYYEKTKGLIRIVPESISKGYLFESEIMFDKYITDLYEIKKSVVKTNPWYLISKNLMNCLYGRMGLRQRITNYSFLNNIEIEKLSIEDNITIKDVIDFENFDKSLVVSSLNNEIVNLKSSVPIAAAITAYARMELSDILLDSSLDILYIDTDSYKCKQKIVEIPKYKHLDHNELGGLKYEGTFQESIFLLPKVYGGLYKESGSEITKVKGFKDNIEFQTLKDLLFKNKEIKLSQNKWYRDMLKSQIKIMRTPYVLRLNDNKRLIDLKTFKTKPYHFDSYDPEAKENIIK